MSQLPDRPPAGHKRYRAYVRPRKANPFRGSGVTEATQTVDVPEETPRLQVEAWAREAATEGGYQFLRLEEVT